MVAALSNSGRTQRTESAGHDRSSPYQTRRLRLLVLELAFPCLPHPLHRTCHLPLHFFMDRLDLRRPLIG